MKKKARRLVLTGECWRCRQTLARGDAFIKDPTVSHSKLLCVKCAQHQADSMWTQIQDQAQKVRNAYGRLNALFFQLYNMLHDDKV